MALVDLFDYYVDSAGNLDRYMRSVQGPPPPQKPGAPVNLRVAQVGTTGTVQWDAPVTDGGSPITGYIIDQEGTPAAEQTPGPTVRTATFTGLSTTVPTRFIAAAVNLIGTGPSVSVSTSPKVSGGMRFPGDTNPLRTGKCFLGIDESDQDPAHVNVGHGEFVAPEAAVPNTPVAFIRKYYTNNTPLTPNTGQEFVDARTHNAKGRIFWPSVFYSNASSRPVADRITWAQAADGRFFTVWYNEIACIEETLHAPLYRSINHEPASEVRGIGSGMTEDDFGHMQREYRRCMDAYAAAHGGVGVYQWKNLAFAPIITAYEFSLGTKATGIDRYWNAAAKVTATAVASTDVFTSVNHRLSNGRVVRLIAPPAGLSAGVDYWVVSATTDTFKLAASLAGSALNVTADGSGITVVSHDVFDFMGVDFYCQAVGNPVWTGNWVKTLAWCEDPAHTYPIIVAEFGIQRTDPQAGAKIEDLYNRLLTHDVIGWAYYNSNTGVPAPPDAAQWSLQDNGGNHLATSYIKLLHDPRSIHFWDLGYPRPAGV